MTELVCELTQACTQNNQQLILAVDSFCLQEHIVVSSIPVRLQAPGTLFSNLFFFSVCVPQAFKT